MIELKTLNGGLNKDDSQYRLPPNDYINALNITHDAVEGSNDQIITPIVANRIGDDTYVYPSGTNKCIGAYANTLRNTIIQFLWNSDDYHLILEYNLTTRLHTKIFENLTDSGDVDILGFTQEGKILSVNIYNRDEGDLLFFLDSLSRPTGLDISLFKLGTYTPVTRAIIDKGKKPPLSPPYVVYDNDTTRRSNNLRNKLFRFKYRWVYDDFEKSTFSPISSLPLPVSILSDVFTNIITNNNVIRMVANTGDKNVKSVEIAMSFVEKTNDWADFQSIIILNKSELGLAASTLHTPGTGLYDQEFIQFTGIVTEGTIVNIFLETTSSILVATYTTISGDDITDVVNGLVASMVSIGIVTSYVAGSDSLLFLYYNPTYTFDRVDIANGNADNDNIDFPFSFYNNSTYPTIDIHESIEMFDYVPKKANAQELLNGNILAYIGITEGYNKDTIQNDVVTINTIAAGNGGVVGNLTAVITKVDENYAFYGGKITFSGIPATGTIINVKARKLSDGSIITAGTYTTVAGDTIEKIVDNIVFTAPDYFVFSRDGAVLALSLSKFTYQAFVSSVNYIVVEITPPGGGIANNSIATHKWSSGKTIARSYFDEKGVTNGILYTNDVFFPAYAEDGSNTPLLPYINYKIYDIPPIWAYSMQFSMNKENGEYKFWQSVSVNKAESEYIYLDVTSFVTNATKQPTTESVLSYTFKDGDRLRILRNTEVPGVVYDDTYDSAITGLVVDPVIDSTPSTGNFLKIKNVEPFTSALDPTKNYNIEIYTPQQQSANSSNQVFYEFGQEWPIIDAGLSTRRHSGMVADQVVGITPAEYNFYEGDAYFRSRTIAVGDVGYATFNVMDRNFVDYYISAVNSVSGRPSIIDLNAREAYYSTLIRHGEAYQANTNINGLNRFYAENFDEYDYSFGDALALVVKNRQLIVLQKFKIGSVPLYSAIGKDGNGTTVTFQTDKLLNPIQYYVGDFGIGNCPESVASFNYAIYGCDNIKGIIWRLSNDGVVPISIKYKMNSWANDNLNQKFPDQKIYGAFDQRLNNYIISVVPTDTVCVPVTIPSITLPNAVTDERYMYSVALSGTIGFGLENIVKPDWMDITVSGNTILFGGIPTVAATDVSVSFTVTNPCGSIEISPLTFNITEMVTGTIDMWGGLPENVPTGWLICDGSAVSRLTFADLFAAIGVLYGTGDGTTTFNLPLIARKVVAGYLNADSEYGTVGAVGGLNSITLTEGQLPAHIHKVSAASNAVALNTTFPADRAIARANPSEPTNSEYRFDQADTGIVATIGNSSTVGSGTSIDNRDAFIVLPFKIKT